jgi:hypothetical protein
MNKKEVQVEAPTTPSGASIHSELEEWKRRLNALATRLKTVDEKAEARAQPGQEATMR